MKRRGTAIVEMALVLPLLLLLILGGLDFALQLHVLHCMTNAAREGARQLAVRGATVEQATAAALDQLSGINATFTVAPTLPAEGETDVVVSISVPRDEVALGLHELLGSSPGGMLQVRTTMRLEQ
jgi:Flp pilus assembly protein TadG